MENKIEEKEEIPKSEEIVNNKEEINCEPDTIPVETEANIASTTPTNNTSTNSKKKTSTPSSGSKQNKKRKKKRPKDSDAPKFPLTGYVRYTNERRDDVRKKNPGLLPVDITKMLAEDWNKMNDEDKKPYLRAAEIDRERYNKEVDEYKQQHDSKKSTSNNPPVQPLPTEKVSVKEKVIEKIPNSQQNGKEITKDIKLNGEIPIFTEEFLEHNKIIDSDLRILRKSNADYEQQNSVLEKHVENMQNGVEKLDVEINSLKENSQVLEKYLDILQNKLATALSGLSLPGHPNGATVENIEEYMMELQEMTTSNTHPPATINKAKDIIRKLDLQFQI